MYICYIIDFLLSFENSYLLDIKYIIRYYIGIPNLEIVLLSLLFIKYYIFYY